MLYVQVKSRLRPKIDRHGRVGRRSDQGLYIQNVGLIRGDKKWSLVTHSSSREAVHLFLQYSSAHSSRQHLSNISLLVKAIICGQNAETINKRYFSAYILTEIMVNLSGGLDEELGLASESPHYGASYGYAENDGSILWHLLFFLFIFILSQNLIKVQSPLL